MIIKLIKTEKIFIEEMLSNFKNSLPYIQEMEKKKSFYIRVFLIRLSYSKDFNWESDFQNLLVQIIFSTLKQYEFSEYLIY